MDLRTPLSKVRGLGSAKDGTEHFWMQRLTAIANVPLVIFLVIVIVSNVGASHAEVAANLGAPLVTVGLLLAVLSITWHMRLGMQVIIEDYVPSEGTKIVCLLANTFLCAGVAVTAGFAILKLGFGA
ncbi:MAG: succinate dehydrogenase, hydrophobic membrane anchor protein [Hyphomicrobiales bacterium]